MSSQKYFTAAGHDPYTAKKKAEVFRVYLEAEYMHAITLFTAVVACLIPPMFGAPWQVTVKVLGGAVLTSIIMGLWASKAYKRPMFTIGYGILAAIAAALIYLGLH